MTSAELRLLNPLRARGAVRDAVVSRPGSQEHADPSFASLSCQSTGASALGSLRIAYVAINAGTCRARFEALRRLGHRPLLIDPWAALPGGALGWRWGFQTGGLGLGRHIERYVLDSLGDRTFDLAYVDSGELLSRRLIRALRRRVGRVINYNAGNPYSPRDGLRWRRFLKTVPEYDLLVVPRASNMEEALARGAREVMRVWFAADDALKTAGALPTEAEQGPYKAALSFVGTWMPERGPLLLSLYREGLPLRIFGPRWDRAPEFAELAGCTRVGELNPQAFKAAVAAADISLALLSKGNRDLHTTRSMEIPSLGSLLCGERTAEHLALYREDEEAAFWTTPQECATVCRALLGDPARRQAMASAGRGRAIANNHFNEPLMQSMLRRAMALPRAKAA